MHTSLKARYGDALRDIMHRLPRLPKHLDDQAVAGYKEAGWVSNNAMKEHIVLFDIYIQALCDMPSGLKNDLEFVRFFAARPGHDDVDPHTMPKPDEVEQILIDGAHKMREVVHNKMIEVREKVGFIHHD